MKEWYFAFFQLLLICMSDSYPTDIIIIGVRYVKILIAKKFLLKNDARNSKKHVVKLCV